MDPDDPKYALALRRLLGIMNDLRAQCPWDRQQTLESLRHLTIEETYELSEAVLAGDLEEIKKELGDLMLHIAFYAKIATERQAFDIADVIEGVCDKLVARHPHVYGDTAVDGADGVARNWEVLKLRERQGKSVLSGVPAALPALIKAQRIQEKARGVGFDWEHRDEVWEKVEEELAELKHGIASGDSAAIEEEFGDVLFSLVNYARFLDINAESALEKTNRKFMRRFAYQEQAARRDGKALPDLSLAEIDAYWEEAKRAERGEG